MSGPNGGFFFFEICQASRGGSTLRRTILRGLTLLMGVEGHERLNWTVTTGTMSLVVPASCHAVSRLLTAYHDNLNNPDDHNT